MSDTETKTRPTAQNVEEFIAAVPNAGRREDAARLLKVFRDVTGFEPQMWGPSIVGFGRYRYVYESGQKGEAAATGFSPRGANMVVYIMPGYANSADLLKRLGPHKLGKSCLYLGRLSGVDESVLRRLIRSGLDDLARHWEILPA